MVYMFLANGFEEVEALCPLDLLRRAGVEVTTVGIGSEQIIGSHGIHIQADIPDAMYRDSNPEMVILPGGMPGTLNLDASATVSAALNAASRKDAYICAICAAPMVLGRRGLLNGYKATCYPGFESELKGAEVQKAVSKLVVADGKRITAAGMGAAFGFGLKLIEALRGTETAEKVRQAVIG